VLALTVIAAVGMLGAAYLEAKFRPPEPSQPRVAADRSHLEGRVSASRGWIPFLLPGIPHTSVGLAPGNHATTADDDGWFSLGGLPPGMYTVTLAAPGFETARIENVAIAGGAVTTLPDHALFPEVSGPPVARLKIGTPAPFGEAPATHPYLTTVYLDATDSENISRTGLRFEIRTADGTLLLDPFSADSQPLQPEKSAIPGTSPALFLFQPPEPGDYQVRLILTNDSAPGVESTAEVTVRAMNTAPVALPAVIPGPMPPSKRPDAEAPASTGLTVVRTGETVFLMGQGLDANHASPERYNPGGVAPDAYGKNHDHRQRQFEFRWQLLQTGPDEEVATDAGELLRSVDYRPGNAGQFVHFNAATPGRYEARLVVSDNDPSGALQSEAASISVLVVADDTAQDGSACASCHQQRTAAHAQTAHAGITCDTCHGPAAAHLAETSGGDNYKERKRQTQAVSRDAGLCGQCHQEYGEWQKSRHADGMPYGHLEIARPLLVQCSKCHYAKTFAEAVALSAKPDTAFHDVDYKIRLAGIGPLIPDLSKVPAAGATGISCVACHDPHQARAAQQTSVRTPSAGALCQTCHEEKWQNAVLEGTAGEVHNGYEYAGNRYDRPNPHDTPAKCVRCHQGDRTTALDARDVRAVGGHTLRMRDAGVDGLLGGFGARADDPSQSRQGDNGDDVLHLAPCQDCHPALATFNRNNAQADIYARWDELGGLLRIANGGTLPGFRPGDKCATCHRGGTVPFDDDPALVLESAYLNYKLIKNDRSWGIHNPPYVRQLLDDSIASVEAYLAAHSWL
jgi:predicted CXXCH cytochrome family protein